MSNSPPDWPDDFPANVRDTLRAAAAGSLAAPIVLTRLFLVLGNAERISSVLLRAESCLCRANNPQGARRIGAVRDLASRELKAFDKMGDVLAILHGEAQPPDSSGVSAVAAAFNAAADLSPAASVALYSLGDPALLDIATQEVVSFLRERGLFSEKSRVLEIGCGIGRFAQVMAGEVASFTGIDVSTNMIRIARERCAGQPNVTLLTTSGSDLGDHADASFDLVLGVDSFPYIVAMQAGLAELHIRESARVLASAGSLVIFNFAYSEDFSASCGRLERLSAETGLNLVASDPAPLRSWDGNFFHLRKQLSIG
jgi:predicted TPR repeat methyltransferase